MTTVGPLELGEIKAVMFDFSTEAAATATLTAPSVAVTVERGTDASPSAVLQGAATINGLVVTQLIRPGVLGCKYKLRASVSDTSGQSHGITAFVDVVRG